MSRQIRVKYDVVESEMNNLKAHLESEIAAMEESYKNIMTQLQTLDGATNAATCEKVIANEKKAFLAAMVLNKLALFAKTSSKIVEAKEKEIANVFRTSPNSSVSRSLIMRGGGR